MLARLAIPVAAAGLLVAGCGAKGPPPAPRVAFVASAAGFGDRAFNDAAAAGLAECSRERGIATATAAPGPDAGPQLVLFATERYDAVIGVGYATAPALQAAARRFDGTHFAIVDATVDQPNVVSLTFDEAQGAFLAGALAALVSKTHHVAFVGGADVPLLQRSEAGFAAGAREIDPRVRVGVRYLESFTDAPAAARAAGALLDAGADVVFVVAGPAGDGAIATIAHRPHAYAIGSDADQDALAPGKVLSSVVKHVDAAVLRVCLETVDQKPETGHVVLGLADGGIGLTDFAYTRGVVGPAIRARLAALHDAVAAGRIAVPSTRAAAARFVPVAVP
jgi:basic membrane protein A